MGKPLISPDEPPQYKCYDAQSEAYPLLWCWPVPFLMPRCSYDGDQSWIYESEHRRPYVGTRAHAPVREQQGEADESPQRPARRNRSDLALVNPDGVRNDACGYQGAREQPDGLYTQATPSLIPISLGRLHFQQSSESVEKVRKMKS